MQKTISSTANPMLGIALALVAGIVCAHYVELALVDRLWWWIGVAVLGVAVVVMDVYYHKVQGLLLFMVGVVGFLLSMFSWSAPQEKLPYDENIDFVARAVARSELKGRYERCNVQLISLKDSTSGLWHKARHGVELHIDTALHVKVARGNAIAFRGKLRAAEGSYGQYMARQGIVGRLYTYRAAIVDSSVTALCVMDRMAIRRADVAQKIYEIDTAHIAATSLMSALAIGERGQMLRQTKEEYRRMGVSHLLAISGMNIGIIFTVLNVLFGWVRLVRFGREIFCVTVIVLLWAYALFTGMSSSIVRAVVMFSLLQIGMASSRSVSSLNILASAAVLMLALRPDYLFDIGFQLSFMAMIGIVTLYRPIASLLDVRNGIVRALWNVAVVSCTAEVAVLPLVAYYFGQIPLMGLVSNLAVWLTVPMIIIGTLLFLVTSIHLLGVLTMWVAELQNDMVSLLAYHKWVVVEGVEVSLPMCVAAYAVLIVLALWVIRYRARHERLSTLRAKYS
ncbi:MAG: ComEC/Rec2 family competence protein [Mucinivorans sp.]